MFRSSDPDPSGKPDAVHRRTFLQMGAVAPVGLSWSSLQPAPQAMPAAVRGDDRACIMIFNLGGPSHLDTLDMKPNAPTEIRGPFGPIRTTAPEIQVSEILPRHGEIAHHISLVRSCYHTGPAVHEVGWQMMQTGHWFQSTSPAPHVGAVVSDAFGPSGGMPAFCVTPDRMGHAGGNLPHRQSAGSLGAVHEPTLVGPSGNNRIAHDLDRESVRTRERYGMNRFGQSCLLARRLVEAGVRFVTVNTFLTVFNEISWDIHGSGRFSTIEQMRTVVAPMYDQAYSALIEDLHQRGMLPTTLVCNLAEFGRTPRINAAGGRDHWPHCFTSCFAGGGVQGGRVIGRSDATGSEPVDRPTPPADIVATIYHSLGLDPLALSSGQFGEPACSTTPRVITELF